MKIKGVLILVLWIVALTPCRAQTTPPDSVYAPLIEAGKSLAQNQVLITASAKDATLSEKRAALFNTTINHAFYKTRVWLDTPLDISAPLALDGSGISMFGGARQVARIFNVAIYVQFADGKTREAIDTTRDGLRLAYALERHSLLGWMTGVAIESMILNTITERLNQLSEVDCKRLFKLAEDWAKTANLLEVALERERLAGLAQLKSQPGQTAEQWKLMEAQVTKAYHQVVQQQRQPYWERGELTLPEGGDTSKEAGEALAGLLRPVFQQVSDRPVRRLAQAQLLGCHAAIRQFRWENRRLPTTLGELKIGEMATDPYTGMEFTYKVKMETFALESVGGYARDDKGTLDKEKRIPVTLMP